ncbi:MAG: acyltransferase [Rhodoferax sp.]|nr:acyltransferase [Rhodoferax sp.]
MLLASHGKRIPTLPAFAYVVIFIVGVLFHWWSIPLPLQVAAGMGSLAVVLQGLKAAPASLRDLLSWRPLRLLGTWSYSIYLWQQPFYEAQNSGLIAWYVAVPGAIACGLLSYYAVEAPARIYLNARWRGRSGSALPTEATERA